MNKDTITLRTITPEELEKQRIARIPLIEKMSTNDVNAAFNEQSTQYKINQILDILEEQGLLRTK